MLGLVLSSPIPGYALDLQGHRGARGLAPENTLTGFASALAIGVTTLEMDLGVSRDGVVVVAHDPELNPDLARGPDGKWLATAGPALHELDLADIRRFDVGRIRPGSRYAGRYPEQRPLDGGRIPTLAEVIELSRKAGNDAVRFNVETKISPLEPDLTAAPEAFARAVIKILRAEGVAGRSTIQSFDWRTLRAANAIAPEVTTACLTVEQRWLDNLERGRPGTSAWTAGLDADDFATVPDLVAAAGCGVWSPDYRDLDQAALARAQALGLEVVVWTVNEPDQMRRLIGLGIDGIISDFPDRLRAVASELGIELPKPTPITP
jgi:glycerophosphoryl diester phosphodiesterase